MFAENTFKCKVCDVRCWSKVGKRTNLRMERRMQNSKVKDNPVLAHLGA